MCDSRGVCHGGCRANSYNLTGNIEGIDPYCLSNKTAYGDRLLNPVDTPRKQNSIPDNKEIYISKQRMVSKCGWATYE